MKESCFTGCNLISPSDILRKIVCSQGFFHKKSGPFLYIQVLFSTDLSVFYSSLQPGRSVCQHSYEVLEG